MEGSSRVEVTVRRGRMLGFLADLSVLAKYLLAVLVVASVAVAVGALSINRMAGLNDDLRSMKAEHVDSMEQLVVVRQGIAENYRGLMLWWGRDFNPAFAPTARATVGDADATVDRALARYRAVAAGSPDRVQAVTAVTTALADYRVFRGVVEFGDVPPAGFVAPAQDEIVPAYLAMEKRLNVALAGLQSSEVADASAMAADGQRAYDTARWTTAGSLAGGLVTALLFAGWINRRVRMQLGSVATSLAAVAAGDLSREAEVMSRDELGSMAAAVNRAKARLEESLLAVEHQREGFRALVQHASDTTVVLDTRGRLTFASPAVARTLGAGPDEVLGRPVLGAVHPDERATVRAAFRALLATPDGVATCEMRVRRADGTWRWLSVVATNLTHLPSVAGVVCNARDVTEAHESHDRLRFDATHDPLTGLANRALFDERLRAAGDAMVLLIDLDDFKPVNDTYGHHVGDELLVAVAQRLRACAREDDTVARLGGDEFAMFVPSAAGPAEMGARVMEAFAEPAVTSAGLLPITASIGVATGSGDAADELLRGADEAMYRAKRAGKNSFATV